MRQVKTFRNEEKANEFAKTHKVIAMRPYRYHSLGTYYVGIAVEYLQK